MWHRECHTGDLNKPRFPAVLNECHGKRTEGRLQIDNVGFNVTNAVAMKNV